MSSAHRGAKPEARQFCNSGRKLVLRDALLWRFVKLLDHWRRV
jgi:hypothetical protein